MIDHRFAVALRDVAKIAVVGTIAVWAPMLAVSLLIPWPQEFSLLALAGWIVTTIFALVVWNTVLSATGLFRLVMYRVWRPGWKPCMCDHRFAYCHRHRSSSREPNRPGVVAAKLKERD